LNFEHPQARFWECFENWGCHRHFCHQLLRRILTSGEKNFAIFAMARMAKICPHFRHGENNEKWLEWRKSKIFLPSVDETSPNSIFLRRLSSRNLKKIGQSGIAAIK